MDIIGILFFRIKIKKWSRRIFALVLCVAIIVNGQFVEVLAAETDDVRLESTQEEDIGEEQDLLLHDVDEIEDNLELAPDVENENSDLSSEIQDKILLDNEDISKENILLEDGKVISENEEVLSVNEYVARNLGSEAYTLNYELHDGKATITGYDGIGTGDIVIPEEIDGYPVVAIGNDAFECDESLRSITIPDGVTSIGEDAFWVCSSLTSITLPDSVTTIGSGAFDRCSSLTSITIPDGVTSIGSYAFYDCSSLTSITIPNSVTEIGDSAFGKCSSLTSIVVETGNRVYDSRNNCNAIIKTATNALIYGCKNTIIPNSVTQIGAYAFCDCSSLTSITIPDRVTSVGWCAFLKCYQLKVIENKSNIWMVLDDIMDIDSHKWFDKDKNEITTVKPHTTAYRDDYVAPYVEPPVETWDIGKNNPSDVQAKLFSLDDGKYRLEISGSGDMQDCCYDEEDMPILFPWQSYITEITELEIGYGVTNIGEYAFAKCIGLTDVTIPNSVTSIGMAAFHNCRGLTSIIISNGVTSINGYPFDGCSSLASIVVEEGNPVYDSRGNCNAIIETATNTLILGCKNTTIPDGVTSIGEFAFNGYRELTSIIISNSVVSIGDFAFNGCSSLTSITIPNSVTQIGWAFDGCSSLASIVVEEGNPVYDSRGNCNAIIETATNTLILGCKNTTIPDGVTSIGSGAFSDCSSLTSITIPDSVTSIGEYAFSGCSSLTSITIPNSLTNIGELAFDGCNQLKKIENKSNTEINLGYIIDTDSHKWFDKDKNEIKVLKAKEIAYREDNMPDDPDMPDNPEFIAHSIADVDVTAKLSKSSDSKKEYTGTYIKPAVLVTYKAQGSNKSITLKENVDYKLSYITNKDVGTAKIRIYGIGEFCDSRDIEFEITPCNIDNKRSKFTIAALPEIVFTTKEQVMLAVSDGLNVTYNGKELVADKDYHVGMIEHEISNPLNNKGKTVKATIRGINNYKGFKEFTFNLMPQTAVKTDISSDFEVKIKKNKTSAVYTGKLIKPAVEVKNKATGKKLKTSDYKVYYYNNLNVGTAKIRVLGTAKYTGSLETIFAITEKDINKCTISVKNTNLLYTGIDQRKNVSITVKDGSNILAEGVDYKIEYLGDWKNLTGKTNKPTIQIKAVPGGNYKDNHSAKKKLTKNFKITKAKLNSGVSISTALMVDGIECELGTGKDAGKYIVPEGKTPEIVVKCSGVGLKGMGYIKKADTTGMDYTFKIKETKKKGKVVSGTITLTGVNNFTGTRTIKYVVK